MTAVNRSSPFDTERLFENDRIRVIFNHRHLSAAVTRLTVRHDLTVVKFGFSQRLVLHFLHTIESKDTQIATEVATIQKYEIIEQVYALYE
jgi:hypothetical protein